MLLGTQRQGRGFFWVGKRQQGRQQGNSIGLGESIGGQHLGEFRRLGLRTLIPAKTQEALQVIDEGRQGTVLRIGRATKLDRHRAFLDNLLLERLHQPRFANARLPMQKHGLSDSRLGVCPALAQYFAFLLSPYQGGSPRSHRYLKPVPILAFSHDLVDR